MQKVLIVDDESPVLRAFNRLFAKEYALTLVNDPLKAVESFADNHYDLILSDIKMPNMDGFELLQAFAAHYPDSGRMLVSGYTDLDECQGAVEKGIADIIVSKPWDNFELTSIVKLLLENGKLKSEIAHLKAQLETK
ncbi:Regulatory protein AtoC [Pseudoalteromonas holothuriae]|uniref:Regulatory protein AtoC n=1 Tax=Pseudoalteromonas holothuriae TaxID=2963714 RepID=A0A9W4VT41_9GAMM|nr:MULTISPECIES: response regulator [unclassified Pseudoalteromonas]CAH9061857.1 Regulatory protein AtoC [Pseudoalteromonas sp. CIP111951]CAH9062152.1 Regulatory protein AtoC [Pseudoalteromonas sp. CIP111854]